MDINLKTLGVLLVLLASCQVATAGQAFFEFIRHRNSQISVFLGTPPKHLVTLTEPTLGTVLYVSANSAGELQMSAIHEGAAAICYELNVDGSINKLQLLRMMSRPYDHCTGIIALLPRSSTCSVQQFLETTGLFTRGLHLSSWLHKLRHDDAFAVITFKYNANVARGESSRVKSLPIDEVLDPRAKL